MSEYEINSPFLAQKSKDKEKATLIHNMLFFPDFYLSDFQSQYESDSTHSNHKQLQQLAIAMQQINRQLLDDMASDSSTNWVCEHVRQGYFSLASVPAAFYADKSEKVFQYLSAIFALAKAKLITRYRDIDSTESGQRHAEKIEGSIRYYLQESRESLRLLMGKSRATIDLV